MTRREGMGYLLKICCRRLKKLNKENAHRKILRWAFKITKTQIKIKLTPQEMRCQYVA